MDDVCMQVSGHRQGFKSSEMGLCVICWIVSKVSAEEK